MDNGIDYEQIKAEYEASTDMKLVEWARPYFENTKKPNSKDKYIICPVSERAADDIMQLTGSDVKGFNHVMNADIIRHISKRHGIQGLADDTISDIRHIGRIAYVLENYDFIEEGSRHASGFKNSKNERAKTIVFVKRIDGHVYAAEAITDSQKSKTLSVTSMYLRKYVKNSAQKRESVIADQEDDLRPNVQNEADSVTSILPQTNKNVNSSDENNSSRLAADPSPRKLMRSDYEAAKARRETERTTAKPSREVSATSLKKPPRRK